MQFQGNIKMILTEASDLVNLLKPEADISGTDKQFWHRLFEMIIGVHRESLLGFGMPANNVQWESLNLGQLKRRIKACDNNDQWVFLVYSPQLEKAFLYQWTGRRLKSYFVYKDDKGVIQSSHTSLMYENNKSVLPIIEQLFSLYQHEFKVLWANLEDLERVRAVYKKRSAVKNKSDQNRVKDFLNNNQKMIQVLVDKKLKDHRRLLQLALKDSNYVAVESMANRAQRLTTLSRELELPNFTDIYYYDNSTSLAWNLQRTFAVRDLALYPEEKLYVRYPNVSPYVKKRLWNLISEAIDQTYGLYEYNETHHWEDEV